MTASSSSRFSNALKRAFLYHWNLLYLGTAAAIGIIAGRADIVYPLAVAVEILYLAVLASNSRFQAVAEAKALQSMQPAGESPPESKNVAPIMQALSAADRERFERLRQLCQKLQPIPQGLKDHADPGPAGINSRQLENINRLLWIYLKLLYSKSGLENFFKATAERQINADLLRVQERLHALGPEHEDDEKETKHRHSLQDMRQTLEARQKNYQNARENYDFLQLELERLNSKIAGIVEMGINRQDAALVSTEIDIVAASVLQTEKTMQELQSITGFALADEKAPLLLKSRKSIQETH
ncbi:MAG: hypothetical protein WAU91_05035 [Desulfatitalea sp.]